MVVYGGEGYETAPVAVIEEAESKLKTHRTSPEVLKWVISGQ